MEGREGEEAEELDGKGETRKRYWRGMTRREKGTENWGNRKEER